MRCRRRCCLFHAVHGGARDLVTQMGNPFVGFWARQSGPCPPWALHGWWRRCVTVVCVCVCVCGCRRYLLPAHHQRSSRSSDAAAACLASYRYWNGTSDSLLTACPPSTVPRSRTRRRRGQTTRPTATPPTLDCLRKGCGGWRPRAMYPLTRSTRPRRQNHIHVDVAREKRRREQPRWSHGSEGGEARRDETRRERAQHTARQPTCERGGAMSLDLASLVDSREAGSRPRWLTSALTSPTSTSQ